MNIKYYTKEALQKKLYNKKTYNFNIPTYKNDGNWEVFEGFHYFKPGNLFDGNIFFAIAFENEKIVGMIAYGFFDNFGCSPLYCGIRYIDVHKDYRQQGIATALIKSICKELKKPNDIKVSQMSEEGKKCHMLDIFHRYNSGKNILYDIY